MTREGRIGQHVDRYTAHHVPVALFVLGGFRAERGGETIPGRAWEQARSGKALLQLLTAVEGHALHQEQIINLLWPDLAANSALNSLTRALYAARHTLEPGLQPRAASSYLHLRNHVVTLDAERVWIDADHFETEARAALVGGTAEALEVALRLYAGGLLADDPRDSWSSERRATLADLHALMVICLSAELERRGARDAAIDHLEQLHRREPEREDVRHQLIRLYALREHHLQALQQYRRYGDVPCRDLEVKPGWGNEALRSNGSTSPADSSGAIKTSALTLPHPVARSSPTPFVGRDRVLWMLQNDLLAAWRGRGGMSLITGEPGIGKSRLIAELGLEATQIGAIVLWGSSYGYESSFPYGVFVGALESYLTGCSADTRQALAEQYPELAPLVPLLGLDVDGNRRAETFDVDDSSMFSVIERFFAHLTRERPMLLVLDDLHLASPSSLHLLHRFARLARERRWYIAATYREEDVQAGSQLQRMSVALTREGLCNRFDLRGLARKDADRLVEAHLQTGRPSEALLNQIYSLTVGNPCSIQELITTLRDQG